MNETTADPRIDEILEIIAENSGIDRSRLKLDTTLDELGITSLKLIEAVFEIESKYDVEISTDGILMTPEVAVGDLIARALETIDAKHAKDSAKASSKGSAV